MKLRITSNVTNSSLDLSCRMGELNGDGDFTHPLVGEETLRKIMTMWKDEAPQDREWSILGPDERRCLVASHAVRNGEDRRLVLIEAIADDTTWLFGIDGIIRLLPYPSPSWEVAEVLPARGMPASAHIESRDGMHTLVVDEPFFPPSRRSEPLNMSETYNDPDFWVDEHSDRL